MGVEGLSKFVKAGYASALRSVNPLTSRYGTLYFDLNNILHDCSRGAKTKSHNDPSTIGIYSNDSDLLLYGLLSDKDIHLISSTDRNNHSYWDLKVLRDLIARQAPHRDPKQAAADFVFITLFGGTDFLPKLAGFDLARVWGKYCQDTEGKGLYDLETQTVDWNMLLRLGMSTQVVAGRTQETDVFFGDGGKNSQTGNVHAAIAIVASCIGQHLKPVYTQEKLSGNEFSITLSIGDEQYGTVTVTNADSAKRLLTQPFLSLDHPFWQNSMSKIPPIFRDRIHEHLSMTRSLSIVPDTKTQNSMIKRFLEGVLWNMSYLNIRSQCYSFHYPYKTSPSLSKIKSADQLPKVTTITSEGAPLCPLLFCIALSNSRTKHHIPEIFHKMHELPHFDQKSDIWSEDSCLDQLSKEFVGIVRDNRSKLTDVELSQLKFQKTILIQRSPHNQINTALVDLYGVVTKGDELASFYNASELKTRSPMEKGFITNWTVEKEIWDALFRRDDLKVKPSETSLLLTETPFSLDEIRKSLYETVFEQYKFKSLYLATRSTFSSSPCHMVVDCGYSFTHVVPHFQNVKLNYAVKRFHVGGKILTNYLKEIVSFRYWDMMHESRLLNTIKERVCYVSPDFIGDLSQCRVTKQSPLKVDYVLPDFVNGNNTGYIKGSPYFPPPGLLFNPSDIGINQAGLAESIVQSINCTNINLQKPLYSNILLLGGSTKFPGFKTRLYNELRKLAPDHLSINIHTPEDPITASLLGGVKFAQQPDYHRFTVSKQEYEESGYILCHRRFT
eukprot:gene14961-17689_t